MRRRRDRPPREWVGLIAPGSWPHLREALTPSQQAELRGLLIALPAETRASVVGVLLVEVERMPFGAALLVALSRVRGPHGQAT